MSRNKIRHVNPYEDSVYQIAGDFIKTAELLRSGFSGTSPLPTMLEALLDLLHLIGNLAEEGVILQAPRSFGKELRSKSDPLIYETDELGNCRSVSWVLKDLPLIDANLQETIDFMVDLVLQLLKGNFSPLKNVLSRKEKCSQKSKRLSHKEYFYFRRKRDLLKQQHSYIKSQK